MPVPLDVTDPATVDAVATLVERRYGRLDILVNNAGILAGWGRPSEIPVEQVRQVLDTNVLGVLTVTNAGRTPTSPGQCPAAATGRTVVASY